MIDGIQTWGVGNWCEIRREYLREWEEVEIKLKCCRLFGKQDLSSYEGWKGTSAEISVEHAKNEAIGQKTKKWVAGVLIDG